jgi:hypothetical protein
MKKKNARITLKLRVDDGATITLGTIEANDTDLGNWGLNRVEDPAAWRRGEYELVATVGTFTPRATDYDDDEEDA